MSANRFESTSFSVAALQQVAEKLADYPHLPPPEQVGKAAAVRLLETPIHQLLEKGYTLKRIVEILKADFGFEISTRSIRHYLPQLRVRPAKEPAFPSAGRAAETSSLKKASRPLRPGEFPIKPDREIL